MLRYPRCIAALLSTTMGLMSFFPGAILVADEGDSSELAQYFGFQPLELYKLERRSANLSTGDFNDDGLRDMVIVDNSHSRLDLLIQRKDPLAKMEEEEFTGDNINRIENDRRFEHRKVSVDKEVAALAVGDFNSNGKIDIAYFGLPDRLIVRFQGENDDWSERLEIRLPDVEPTDWLLAAGDLTDDGRDDLVALGTNDTYLIVQSAEGALGTPLTLMNTSGELSLAQIADLDGDGRNDLSYLGNDAQGRSLCVRLQGEDGKLGPELRFDLNRPRSVTLAEVDRMPGSEILAIDSQTGRLKISKIAKPQSKSGELANRLIQFGFGQRGAARGRDMATGDVNGDGLTDVVVSDPESARIIVFRQNQGSGMDLGNVYPGLLGTEHVRTSDLDGDGSDEVVVLSGAEKTLGICRMESGRLTFPQALPIAGDGAEPVAMELADLDGDSTAEIVYITRTRKGRSSEYAIHALGRSKDGNWSARKLGEEERTVIELRGTPERMMRLDANADGAPDFLVFLDAGRGAELITMSDDGSLKQAEPTGGIQLGELSSGAVFVGSLDGRPAILAAQESFARNLRLSESQQWQVVDQYNASESSARIVGAASIDLDGEPGHEIVLVDAGVKKLRILRREDNLFRPWREVEMGDFPFKATYTADLNGDGKDDLILFGARQFAVLFAGRTNPTVKELASFESKLDDVYFADAVAGDLNQDGHVDIALVDTRSNYIEVLDYDGTSELKHAMYFRVFEEKTFSRQESGGSDPREAIIQDVTNDGRDDLILLTHDRVLVYPQDPGESSAQSGGGQ